MPDSDSDINLSFKDNLNLSIQTCLDLIPYGLGSFLLKLYYGVKSERRIKRIEIFINKLALRIGELEDYTIKVMQDKLESLCIYDKEALVFIMEELLDKVEREVVTKKLDYLQNYFINMLWDSVNESNFDERKFFLDSLGAMSLLECELLTDLYGYKKEKMVKVGDLKKEGIDQYAIVGGINRLKSYGFLRAIRPSVMGKAEYEMREEVELSSFGLRFYEFCIKS